MAELTLSCRELQSEPIAQNFINRLKTYQMKRFLLFTIFCLPLLISAQSVHYDWETTETSNGFVAFGGNLDGTALVSIANPDASGVNTSANVLEVRKSSDAPEWGGIASEPRFEVDATTGGQICFDFWSDHAATVRLKIEMATFDDPANYEMDATVSTPSAWETLCFDLGANSLGGDMTPATGKRYMNFVVFPDWLVEGNGTETVYYLDNIVLPDAADPIVCASLYDFETSRIDSFSTFGATDTTLYASQLTIANPAPDGVNGSDNVMKYTKQANAASWAGFFWTLNQPIDANTAYEVCLDYWSPVAGQILVKLENGDVSQNWENAAQNSVAGGWETLCVNLGADTQGGDSMGPATGRTFTTMVLFPEFNVEGGADDVDFYIDNIVVKSDFTIRDYDVTFSVDMNDYPDAFSTVYVSGGFNGWAGVANPMEDTDGDGIWTTTITIPQGEIEYKFTIDDWAAQEEFNRFDECTKVTDDGQFVNRVALVSDNIAVGPYCFSECYDCGNSYTVTWNVDYSGTTVGPGGAYVAGGCCFGNSVHELTDDDGDGIYSLTLRREAGFESHYTFLSDACPGWECKEQIAGQECSDPNNFDDRFLPALNDNLVINTCYGQCIDGPCEVIPRALVTFRVNMNNETVSPDTVRIAGTFNGWLDQLMTDDGDGTYSFTTELDAGDYEYKFKNGPNVWEEFMDGDACTKTTDDAGSIFINRFVNISGNSGTEVLTEYCFNTCENCEVGVNDLIVDNSLFSIQPTISSEYFDVSINSNSDINLRVISMDGRVMTNTNLKTGIASHRIDAGTFDQGMYLVSVTTDTAISTQRVLVTK